MRISDIPGNQTAVNIHRPKVDGKTVSPLQFDRMAERINYIQNTTMEFKLNRNTFITDTREFSKNVLGSICKFSIPLKKPDSVSDPHFILHTEESINKGIKEWRNQEKTTFISAFINRTIDQTCRENYVKIGKTEKENLFNEIKKTFFPTTKLNTGCAQSSVIQALLNDSSLAENISKLDIENEIPDNTADIMLSKIQSMTTISPDHPVSTEERQNQQKDLAEFNRQYKAALTGERTAIRADIYNYIAENIFNTFLCDQFYGGNSGAVEFNKLRETISEMVLSRAVPVSESARFFFSEHPLSVTTRLPDGN
ncbi:hypothetical protein CKG00_14855 (plasmid) [Morganella morganii]|uniref:Uncharacterized protein n=1 Tax=Morganella morganii TaxID=582 RepID=A0A433ZQT8_MORMO|nr:hypothetical protein [Morganella morganii]RUT64466.1 hypothetical protein CKG00_14855 [Morganella morganii]